MLKFKIDIFGSKVIFFGNKKEFDKFMKKLTGDDFKDDTRAGLSLEVIDKNTGRYKDIIYADGTQSALWYKSTAVHEISHVVDNILNRYSVTCGESRAYLFGYIYRKIIKHIDLQYAKKTNDS